MTLCVNDKRIPVIRHLNFHQNSINLDINKIKIIIGNEKNNNTINNLKQIKLKEYLNNFDKYITKTLPNNQKIKLLHNQNSHVIITSQG